MSKHSEARKDGAKPRPRLQRTDRFRALLSLAREGNEDAIGDLWREFNFDFHKEGSGHE